jgi:hypothetical protein
MAIAEGTTTSSTTSEDTTTQESFTSGTTYVHTYILPFFLNVNKDRRHIKLMQNTPCHPKST